MIKYSFLGTYFGVCGAAFLTTAAVSLIILSEALGVDVWYDSPFPGFLLLGPLLILLSPLPGLVATGEENRALHKEILDLHCGPFRGWWLVNPIVMGILGPFAIIFVVGFGLFVVGAVLFDVWRLLSEDFNYNEEG